MSNGAATFDHAHAVAAILAGCYRAEMAERSDDTAGHALEQLQDGRARDEDRSARQAEQNRRAAGGPRSARPSDSERGA